MQYLKDFADIDKSQDGSLGTEELVRAYHSTDAADKASQAIQILGQNIDIRTYMKWRRGDYHEQGEIERHSENSSGGESRVDQLRQSYSGTGQEKIDAFFGNADNNAIITNSHFEQWFQEFSDMDTDKSGDIGEKELIQAYASKCGADQQQCNLDAHRQAVEAINALKNSEGNVDVGGYMRWRMGATPKTMEDVCDKAKQITNNAEFCNETNQMSKAVKIDLMSRFKSESPTVLELYNYIDEFKRYDEDKDGFINVEELSNAYKESGTSPFDSTQLAFKALESKEGTIGLEDFIVWKHTNHF